MPLFSRCYDALHRQRGLVLVVLLLVLAVCGWRLQRISIEDSIIALLPDGKTQVAADFELLQQAPFARKVVIHLQADTSRQAGELAAATETLRASLPEPLFRHAQSGVTMTDPQRVIGDLLQALPLLLDAADLQTIAEGLTPEAVSGLLRQHLAALQQPQGMLVKELIRRDPFDLHRLALAKLRALNPLPQMRLEGQKFVSTDGLSRLILADTDIAITDAEGSRRLLAVFADLTRQLPEGIRAELISGHAYTLANTDRIMADMHKVLLLSAAGLMLLFVVMVRRLRALPVFVLPFFSMLIALVVTSLWFDQVSGITIGFGAVLLGITIDFGLHVYLALQQSQQRQGELLQLVARPVLFGGLTTLAAFLVLLASDLPGQRQIGLFAGSGIVAALLLALLVLPHCIGRAAGDKNYATAVRETMSLYQRFPRARQTVLLLWLGIVGASLLLLPQLTLSGELRKLGYLPAELLAAEQRLSHVWGEVRGKALIFVAADDEQTALQRNEQLWALLTDRDLEGDAVSLAPLLLSQAKQQQRLADWRAFWAEHRESAEHLLIRQGAEYGFSAQAFTPFFAGLDARPQPVDAAVLARWGLTGVVEMLKPPRPGSYQLMTLVPDRPEVVDELTVATLPEGVTLVSQSRFGQRLGAAIAADFYRFLTLAAVVVVGFLGVLFRRVQDVLLALLPATTGLVVMLGGMVVLGLELNLFNVVASLLVMGLGVDYGIFMVCHGQGREDLASRRAVLISGVSTLIGFGALALASHPALFSIGVTLLLGISAAMPTALLVVPAWQQGRL